MINFDKKIIIEDKLKIAELQKKFQRVDSFTTTDLSVFYKQFEESLSSSTLNWRIYYLVDQGILQRIGRGLFKFGKGVFFKPELNIREVRIYNYLKRELPYLECCVWNFDLLKALSQHIPNLNFTFVEVERHATESVQYLLQEKHKHVFSKRSQDLRNAYFHNFQNVILVRPLVTEAPVQLVNKVVTITIEKLLVDVFCDDEFDFLKGMELTRIFENVFDAYTINQSKLLRYADRKQKKEALRAFLKTYKLAVK